MGAFVSLWSIDPVTRSDRYEGNRSIPLPAELVGPGIRFESKFPFGDFLFQSARDEIVSPVPGVYSDVALWERKGKYLGILA